VVEAALQPSAEGPLADEEELGGLPLADLLEEAEREDAALFGRQRLERRLEPLGLDALDRLLLGGHGDLRADLERQLEIAAVAAPDLPAQLVDRPAEGGLQDECPWLPDLDPVPLDTQIFDEPSLHRILAVAVEERIRDVMRPQPPVESALDLGERPGIKLLGRVHLRHVGFLWIAHTHYVYLASVICSR